MKNKQSASFALIDFGCELPLGKPFLEKKPSANFALIAFGCELPLGNPN